MAARVLHDFDTPRVEWPYIPWQPMKESYSIRAGTGHRL